MDVQAAAEKRQQEIALQASSYAVIVDGNKHRLNVAIRTKKEQITVAKCKEIVKNVESNFDIKVGKIEIMMSEYDFNISDEDYLSSLYQDVVIRQIKDKKAIYNAATNCLQIWEGGMPVYENNNGVICRDQDALADCLM
jgi:hypothetical protein